MVETRKNTNADEAPVRQIDGGGDANLFAFKTADTIVAITNYTA